MPTTLEVLQLALRNYQTHPDHLDEDGRPSHYVHNELPCAVEEVAAVAEIAGLPIEAFEARHLAMVRNAMATRIGDKARPLTPGGVNRRLRHQRLLFNHAASELGLMRSEQAWSLKMVKGVRRPDDDETDVPAADWDTQVGALISAIIGMELPALNTLFESGGSALSPAMVKAMRRQWFAGLVWCHFWIGARPGEITRMSPQEIDTSGDVWTWKPRRHKNKKKGRKLIYDIGPRALIVLREFVFGFQLAFHQRSIWPYRSDKRTAASYNERLGRECKKHSIPRFKPNQVRHEKADQVANRHALGLEASRVSLGHGKIETTKYYTKFDPDAVKRLAIASECG